MMYSDKLRNYEPLVTVLIAAYNAEEFIQRAVNSARSQSYTLIEIIVVDDCSKDKTSSVVETIALEDNRVRCLRLAQNGGPSKARNVGIEHAHGEFVAVLDADDAFAPERIANLVAVAAQADIVADDFRYYDPVLDIAGKPSNRFDADVTPITLRTFLEHSRPYRRTPDFGLLKPMFRRSFLADKHISYREDVRHGEDFLLIVNALLHGARYLVCREPGYLYTHRAAGWSRTTISYEHIIDQSQQLLLDRRIGQDPLLRRAVVKRVSALNKLVTERSLQPLIEQGQMRAIFSRMLKDRDVVPLLVSRMERKLRNVVAKAKKQF
jgi:succinoglycan biosynthesis protein ExoO